MKVEELHDIFIEKLWYKNVDIEAFWERFDENINWILDTRNINLIESIFKNIKEIKNNYSKNILEIKELYEYFSKNNIDWKIENIIWIIILSFLLISFLLIYYIFEVNFLNSIFFSFMLLWIPIWLQDNIKKNLLNYYSVNDSNVTTIYHSFFSLVSNEDIYNQQYNKFLKQIKDKKRKESKNNLLKMAPYDFEKLTAEVFNYFWFSSKVTKWSWDHWIDINLTKNWEKYIVQCKRYNWTIGTPLMRDFIWTMQLSGINKWFFVTTWAFSSEVVKLINKNNFYIKLIDLDSLFNLITIKNDWWNINEFEMILSKWFENINNQAEQNIQNKKDWWNKFRWY